METILLAGDWSDCSSIPKSLLEMGNMVSFLPDQAKVIVPCDLMIARIATAEGLEKAAGTTGPWLAWCISDTSELGNRAYEKGALAVFSKGTPEEIVLQVTQKNLKQLHSLPGKNLTNIIQRKYQRGDVILLEQDAVLEIQQGIIAQTMVYQDGTETLLGLCGPQQVVLAHPADTCFIQLMSQTESVVRIQSWEHAYREADFPMKVRARLRQMEAWAAMQARPHLDQRVLGILSLLAEQFGVETPQGRMVDVRITHIQLASAVGATRTTITRTLGDLRKRGILSLVETADGERFCLTQWEHGHHDLCMDSG